MLERVVAILGLCARVPRADDAELHLLCGRAERRRAVVLPRDGRVQPRLARVDDGKRDGGPREADADGDEEALPY
eukprot:1595980-Prymnesium_polylepis.1